MECKNHLKIFSVLFAALVLIACDKEIKYSKVNITTELNDDVSPTRVVFKIDEMVSRTEWQINDTLVIGFDGFPEGEPHLEYIFNESGDYDIALNGDTYTYYEKVYGEKSIQIGPLANKLKLIGLDFRHYKFSIEETTFKLKIIFAYDSEIHFDTEMTVQYDPNLDSLDFSKPIILDLPNMETTDKNGFYCYFEIIDESNIEAIFQGSFYMNYSYFVDRLYINPNKGTINERHGSRTINLNLDWYYEN